MTSGIHSFHALNSKNGKSQSVKKTLEWDYGNSNAHVILRVGVSLVVPEILQRK